MSMRFYRVALVLVAVVALAGLFVNLTRRPVPPNPADFTTAHVVYVIDGDTLDVEIEGERTRVRLIGIDAPESANHDEGLNTPEGERATEHARELLSENVIVYLQMDTSDFDRYGRLLRYVWMELPKNPDDEAEIATKMFDARMVIDGYAQAVRFEPDTRYASLFERFERQAVEDGAGVSYMWA